LQDAKDALVDYSVYANLSGIVSVADVSQGDNVSSGTTIATIITKSKIAKITLSESDIANIRVGQKATLTFDAIDGLSIVGQVSEVDSVGAASSGVVSYGIEIAFDTDTDSVKPGMSVSATIITDSKSDVLTVPTTAVKSYDDGTYYVQVLSGKYDLTNKTNSIKGVTSATTPTTKTVTIGLADDTNTEITGGLSEGDQIVVRVSSSKTTSTSSGSSSSKASSSKSILNAGGGAGGPPGM
jgi:HlyD family secretion protein